MLAYYSIIIKLIVSVLLGGAIGLERERSNQPAGFRTHVILCVGSTLIMMISIYMSENYGSIGSRPDPARIAAQVVSGIGFLGAGAILRIGVSVKGLTTAASLWTTGGIGLAIGCGFYFGAIVAVVLIVITLGVLSKVERLFLEGKLDKSLNITAQDVKGIIGKIENIMTKYSIALKNIQVSRSSVKDIIEINAIVNIPSGMNITSLINELTVLTEISEVEIM